MNFLFGNGRFEAASNPQKVVSNRSVLWKKTHLWSRNIKRGFSSKDGYWLSGVDTQTNQPVLIHPRGDTFEWTKDIAFETMAKRVQALSLPGTVPILHVGRGVVFAQPPPARPRPNLSLEVAAKLALEAATITAHLHAEGCARFAFGPSNLRIDEHDGDWQMHWLIPGITELDLLEEIELQYFWARDREGRHSRWDYKLESLQRDLWQLCFFFFSLLDAKPDSLFSLSLNLPLSVRRDASGAAFRTLRRMSDDAPAAVGIHDAASMARLFATIARVPPSAIESLPIVPTLPRLYPDWDEVIADGEALLRTEKHCVDSIQFPLAVASHQHNVDSIQLSLAVAYHQRASRAWARGDLDNALRDADLAIFHDSHAPYHTTRAIVLDAMGRGNDADAAIALAFDIIARPEPKSRWFTQREQQDDGFKDLSRAYLTRGIIAWRNGDVKRAIADVRRANELHSTDRSASALEMMTRKARRL